MPILWCINSSRILDPSPNKLGSCAMREPLIIVGPLDVCTGYGANLTFRALSLLDRGRELFIRASSVYSNETSPVPYRLLERRIHCQGKSPFELVIAPPGFRLSPNKKSVWSTTLECDSVSKEAVLHYNQAEALIVPSHWNKTSLENAGVTVPIYVCPEPLDTTHFFYRPPHQLPLFIFGTGGNVSFRDGGRKGFQDVVAAFLKAFPKDRNVRLYIKTAGFVEINTNGDKRISVITDILSPAKLADWYASLNVFVTASRGEGWGRMLYEALACGRPGIAIPYGGHQEFFCRSYGWPVAYEVEQGQDRYSAGCWARPALGYLSRAMATARRQPELAEAMGKAASYKAAEVHGLAGDRLEGILDKVMALPAKTKAVPWSTPEDYVRGFYESRVVVPKLPIPDAYREKNLTNSPCGIGDSLIMSAIPKMAAQAGRKHGIFHNAPHFDELSLFIENFQKTPQVNALAADKLQRIYDMGAGHFIQRLQRAFGYTPDILPKAGIVCHGQKVPGRIAVHLAAGRHATWQRQYVHPKAREVYPENVAVISELARDWPQLELIEVGATRLAGEGVHDYTGKTLSETIRLLATCEFFLGIVSGPMHLATALGCKGIVVLNFPRADQIVLPTLKDIALIESEWLYPQNTHLHQDGESFLVPRFGLSSLKAALDGEVYPFWSHRYLDLTLP